MRPYAMTRGRTGADCTIAFEAQVVATTVGARMRDQFQWEVAEIINLAEIEIAVVELAARLDLPIGVVRVLVSDLTAMGAVVVSNPAAEMAAQGGEEYTALLEKVVEGIKAL